MEQYKDKYPDWFDEEGNYIQGSLENQIERTKDNIRTCNNAVLYGEETEFSLPDLKLELEVLKGLAELDASKKKKLNDIIAYDESKAVNQFYLGGIGMWYKADKRATIRNLVESNIKTGNSRITLWTEEEPIVGLEFDCESALMMLAQLEVYAGNCLAVTQQHKANVMALTSKEEVENYDYTTGYPEKLNFEL